MSLLTEAGQKRYALAKGKRYVAICDRPNCRRLIPVGELYTVVKWKRRTDGLVFLGPLPKVIRCKDCQEKLHPRPVVDKEGKKLSKIDKMIRTAIIRLYTKYPKSYLSTALLVSKLQRKKKFKKIKHREIVKVLKMLKKEKYLIYKEKLWKLRVKK